MARFVTVTGGLALVAVLLAGCGGGGIDGTKVEASLRDYLSAIDPNDCLGSGICRHGAFPVGAGIPRVKENSCKKAPVRSGPRRPVHFPKGQPRPPRIPEGLTAWICIVTFGRTRLPVLVAVKRSGDVYLANPMWHAPPLPPATTYEGGP